MHQAPLKKIAEILGADSVMYVTLKDYGTKFTLLNSVPTVRASAKLVDTRTEILLWEGEVFLQESSQGSGSLLGDLIGAVVKQVINTTTDRSHALCGPANAILFATKDQGLLYGPYHPADVASAK
jgi:hypothetical protein